MCYDVYDGIGETCWCWDATAESNSWVMKSLTYKHWLMKFWSYVLNSEVSTNWCLFMMTSRLCHVWLCDVASPIPSWHRLRRWGVTFLDSTSFAANLFTYLLWFIYRFSFAFWSVLEADLGVDSCRTFSSHVGLAALLGIFLCVLEDISRSFEDYITVDHAVDRSLCRADFAAVRMYGVVPNLLWWIWFVSLAEQSDVWGSHTYMNP